MQRLRWLMLNTMAALQRLVGIDAQEVEYQNFPSPGPILVRGRIRVVEKPQLLVAKEASR